MIADRCQLNDALGALIDSAVSLDRMIAQVTAMRMEVIDQVRQLVEFEEFAAGEGASGDGAGGKGAGPWAWTAAERARRTTTAELAAALRMPERTVQGLIAESETIVHELPVTREALAVGDISYRHAQKIVDHAWSLPEESRPDFELAVLPVARTQTVAKLDRRARAIRERMHPDSLLQRRVAAIENRQLTFDVGRDGMSFLTGYLPSSTVLAIYERATDLATAAIAAGDTRTLDQVRADIFADLLVNGVTPHGLGLGIRATVAVTVPVLTLMGASDEPGYLHGVGPIDADTARALAGTATSFTRILTHPETGAVLSVGRTSYAVPSDLKRWLALRDETCRFPGCNRAAKRCDIDHTGDWIDLGATEHDNLAHLCRGHHHLKHQTRWLVSQLGGGVLEWVAPSGHAYRTEPAVQLSA